MVLTTEMIGLLGVAVVAMAIATWAARASRTDRVARPWSTDARPRPDGEARAPRGATAAPSYVDDTGLRRQTPPRAGGIVHDPMAGQPRVARVSATTDRPPLRRRPVPVVAPRHHDDHVPPAVIDVTLVDEGEDR